MNRMSVFIIASCAAFGVLFALYSLSFTHQAIYVAVDGSDQNEGTLERPFQTIAKASLEAEAGTTVYIREGTYKEPLVVQHSGTKYKPITFQAYQGEKVIVDGENLNDSEGDRALVVLEDKNYINIEGLTIKNVTTDTIDETVMGFFISGSSSHITVRDNIIKEIKTWHEEGNGHGIAVYGTGSMRDINIIDNIVEDLKLGTSESVVLNGDIDGFTIEGNKVQYSDNIGIDLIGYEGVANNPSADYVRNGIVQNNTVHHVSSFTNPAYNGEYSAAAIYVDGGKDILIKENELYENDIGIEATSEHSGKYAENIQMIDNLISNNYYIGIAIGGYDEERGGTRNTLITNNTLYQNDTKHLKGGQLLVQYNVHDNEIRGNKFTASPSRIFIANFFRKNRDNRLIEKIFYSEQSEEAIWIWEDEEYRSFSAFREASGSSDEKSPYIDTRKEE
ncbi:DUF1565 domain-containing protein [Oceanobacillus jeddahense]|uniref:DUF1565 domain-containing protein n=1 Tax=Oceanobacillus jeddahense TaxID=1462527 RepID=A0ABY5JUT5_9BACI|nr:right-handed parallel beta-helix repeat-containing protein [Oceanobacillus jeddahense]UUI04112.1 DUF1565 domain-containing protein [Oceanobacillus jeddahense]